MLYAKPNICPGEWDVQTPLGFWDTNGSPISARRPDLIIIMIIKRTCTIVHFVVLADLRAKLKEREKKDKYLDLASELKKLWNLKVTVIPVIIGALATVTKGLVQGLEYLEIRGQVETVQTTALWRSARILRRVQEIKKTCYDSNSSEIPSTNADMKNSQEVNNNAGRIKNQRKNWNHLDVVENC